MAGYALTPNASLQCPHGGTVQIVPSQTQAQADKAPMATAADTFSVVGCPFQIPGTPPIPSPCVAVQWLIPDTKVKAGGTPTLSAGSTGICLSAAGLPQGPPSVVSTQTVTETL